MLKLSHWQIQETITIARVNVIDILCHLFLSFETHVKSSFLSVNLQQLVSALRPGPWPSIRPPIPTHREQHHLHVTSCSTPDPACAAHMCSPPRYQPNGASTDWDRAVRLRAHTVDVASSHGQDNDAALCRVIMATRTSNDTQPAWAGNWSVSLCILMLYC